MDYGTSAPCRWRSFHIKYLEFMFGLFKKKSEKEKLNEKYMKLLEESKRMSTSNRSESDRLVGEAEKVLDRIKAIEANEASA